MTQYRGDRSRPQTAARSAATITSNEPELIETRFLAKLRSHLHY